MSLSKHLYAQGYIGKVECKYPILHSGQRFVIDFGRQKNEQGTWEIVNNENAPLYKCIRVLKNGKLSKSKSLNNYRNFHELRIYRAIDSGILFDVAIG